MDRERCVLELLHAEEELLLVEVAHALGAEGVSKKQDGELG